MSEEEINKLVEEHYGFTIDEVDESIGYWCTKWAKLQQENQQLKEEIKEIKEEVINKNKYIFNEYKVKEMLLENANFKSVLDEIREYLMQQNIEVREYYSCDMDFSYANEKILQILDKVKE